MDRPIAFRRARVVTDLASGTVIDDAGIVCANGKVAVLGSTADADRWVKEHDWEGPEVIDLAGRVVLPGLINAHTHLYSTLARGMSLLPGMAPPENFKQILEEIWWPLDRALDEEDVYVSALVGLAECARAGVTTTIDHHASETAIEGSLGLVARAARAVGVRVATCFEVTDRDGLDVAKRGIDENVRFAKTARETPLLGGAPQVAATFGLHAALTLSDETLAKARDARAQANLPGFHVHVSESTFDLGAVTRLAKAGILGPGTIAAHCVHVDDRERAILADTRTLVVTNPSSNRNNAVGRSPVAAHLKSGVTVAIGSDGMTPDVLHELEQLFLGCKEAGGKDGAGPDPRAGWDECARALAATKDVAHALFPGAKLGALAVGGPADLAVLEYVPWTPFESTNWLGHVLYGALGARVRHTVCGGRFVLRDFELPEALDVDRLCARARERARSLWSRRPLPRRS